VTPAAAQESADVAVLELLGLKTLASAHWRRLVDCASAAGWADYGVAVACVEHGPSSATHLRNRVAAECRYDQQHQP